MRHFLLIITFSLFNSFLTKEDNKYILAPGKGTKNLQIGKTKIKTAFSLFGKNDDFTQGISEGLDWTIYHNRYIYTRLGLTIISHTSKSKGADLNNAVIDNIYFTSPANAETTNGIILSKDSLEKVRSLFGIPSEEINFADITSLHYSDQGITFIFENETRHIIGIEVFKAGSDSDHR